MANMQNPVLKNVESGQIIELVKSPFSIGRGLTSDYVIENKIVSRIHCSLTKTDEGWTLTDSSTNGTLVNDGHFKGETSPILKQNDEISLGYQNYTYRFIIEVEKAPNCQVDKLKSQEFNGNTSILNETRSPGTPNSFDENGISDELLNNLADNMLSAVGEPTTIAEPQAHDSLQNVEKPIASMSELTSHQSEQGTRTVDPPSTVPSTSVASNNDESNVERNNAGEAVGTADTNDDAPKQVTSKNEELNNQKTNCDELTQSASSSSVSTIIYSLPDEIVPEVPQTVIDNKTEAFNMDMEQNTGLMAAQVSVGSTNAGGTVMNATMNRTNTIAKPRDLLAESIEAVVQGYSKNVTSSSTGTAGLSTQGPSWVAGTSNTASSTSAPIVPTTVTMASPLNVNKKVKVMAVSSGVVNQLRPVTEQAYTMGNGERAPMIRKLSQDEMQRILANQPGMPIVILDKFPPGSAATNSAGTPNAGGHTVSRNTMGGITTFTTSTTAATNSTNFPGRISVLEGLRRSIHNPKLSVSTRNGIKRALRNYEQYNPGVLNTTTGGSTVRVSGNTFLQSTENQNTPRGVSRIVSINTSPQTANNQTTTRLSFNNPNVGQTLLVSGNTLLQSAEDQNTTITGISRIVLGNSWQQTANNSNTTTGNTTLVSGSTLLQTAKNQGTTTSISRIVSTNTGLYNHNNQNTTAGSTTVAPQITTLQSTENDALTTGNIIGSTDVIDSMEVPAAVQEVIVHTVKATGATTIQGVPSIKCHDSQEAGTSKAPGKSEADIEKQKNQNHYEEMENELMCTICANLFIKSVTLGCSHSFCQYCIGEWKKKKTDCPICRNKIASMTRTLVLDNIIEKMIETASEVDKEDRTSAIEERKRIEDAEIAKKNQQNANKHNGRGGRGRRVRGNANHRVNQGNNARYQPDVLVTAPVITIPDSPSTTDGDDSSDNSNYGYDYGNYYSDEWYNGRPGAFYGGYGSCYTCGERGHWANGCPNR